MDKTIIEKIYNDVFLYIQHSNIDLFLLNEEQVINRIHQTVMN